jgi:FAD-linked oxidoreductase
MARQQTVEQAAQGAGTWRNWAGNQAAWRLDVVAPRSVEEVVAVVESAAASGRRVKAVGAGHSFTAVARPEEVALRLDRLCRLRRLDTATGRATAEAGMTLNALSGALAPAGLALANLGDIDAQTLAGAVATGTHGTGARFGGLATQVTGIEVVTADGSLRWWSDQEDPASWAASRVHLGALGVVTAVEVQAVPAFALAAEEGTMAVGELLDRFDELADGVDHFEAYWFPHTGRASTKRNTRVGMDQLAPLPGWREWLDDSFLQNTVFGATVAAGRRLPAAIPTLNRVAAAALGQRRYTDVSHRVFSTPRRVRFREMEYAVGRDVAVEAIRAVVTEVESSPFRVAFPVELRVAAADDIPLSTASGRDSAYVAVHLPAGADHRGYFGLVESVLAGAGGRPHWGKLHTLDAAALAGRYPGMGVFAALRRRVDPSGVFANAELERILPQL